MFRIFRNIGIITLVFISFIYTERIVSVVKDYDGIMIEIKHTQNQYKEDPIEATLTNRTIIPGLKGKKVNIDESYAKMKKYGKFEKTLLSYQDVYPQNRLKDHLDKLIIQGNPNKKMVSILFLLNNIDEIEETLKILDNQNVKANFFIDSSWIGNNETTIINLIRQGHNVGNLSYREDYSNSKFIELDHIIKKLASQKISYCYSESYLESTLKICSKQNDYTIKPNIIVNQNLLDLKKNLVPGSIISIKNVNSNLNLDLMIQYIKGKGYEIVNLKTLLSE